MTSGFWSNRTVKRTVLPMCAAAVSAGQGVSLGALALAIEMDALGLHPHIEYEVGSYTLDFFFPEVSLAIEVDGSGHVREAAIEHDRERDLWLETFEAIDVQRIPWNNGRFLLPHSWGSAAQAAEWVRSERADRLARALRRTTEGEGLSQQATGNVIPLRLVRRVDR